MKATEPIPIFPLPLVVCPDEVVPLHIFEPRYRDLVATCRARAAAGDPGVFAVFFQRSAAMCSVGCTLRIASVLKEYADGRLDLLAVGTRRCVMLERFAVQSYDTATVAPMIDAETDWDESLATEAFALHRGLIRLITGTEPDAEDYSGKRCLSFHLAKTMALSPEDKQRLLETDGENARLRFVISRLKRLLQQIEAVHVAARAIQQGWNLHRTGRPPDGC